MEILGWALIWILFIISFIGLVYPIIPAVLFLAGGFVTYGLFFGFAELPWWFWTIEALFVILLFGTDLLASAVSLKRFGGSKAGLWGSTLGLLIGPFVIPVAGILIGPFIGAIGAELIVNRTKLKQSVKAGIGSVIGLLTSVVVKGILQIVMILIFFVAV